MSSVCSSCGARIMFLRTEKGAMPIDPPFPNSSAVPFDQKIHTSHFATCPNAAAHRRPKFPDHGKPRKPVKRL